MSERIYEIKIYNLDGTVESYTCNSYKRIANENKFLMRKGNMTITVVPDFMRFYTVEEV